MKRALLFAIFVILAAGFCVAQAPAPVKVEGGLVQGAVEDGLTVYRGIPFAAPPVDDLRWRAPQPVVKWDGVKETVKFAPACIQGMMMGPGGSGPAPSEDCLYLNIWSPAKSPRDRVPVFVWIYGGGFAMGSTSDPTFGGEKLANKGVMLVSIAYRVGQMGFFVHPELSAETKNRVSGNYGLLDMISGLQWIRKNIAAFGGDPQKVTIFGESAGGIAVSMLSASPLAKGLFHGAISQSGGSFGPPRPATMPGENMKRLADAERSGEATLKTAGVASIADARKLPPDKLSGGGARGQAARGSGGPPGLSNWPIIDGWVIPDDQYKLYESKRYNDVPVLIGYNSDEGLSFSPPRTPEDYIASVKSRFGPFADKLIAAYPPGAGTVAKTARDLMRDAAFGWHTWIWARLQSKTGKSKVFYYYFDQHPDYPADSPQAGRGSPHGQEVAYVFQHLNPNQQPAKSDEAISEAMATYWTNFAKFGDPNGAGLPKWPVFSDTTPVLMYFAQTPHTGPVPSAGALKVMDQYFAWRRTPEGEAFVRTVNTDTAAEDGSAASDSATVKRVSRPGEYAGYSDAIYDDKYELTSQYVQVSDGTRLAMDLYRPKDKATGKVIEARLPVLWMHTPYNRRYSGNDKTLTGEGYPGTAAKLVKYGYVVAIVDFRGLYASYGHNVAFNRGEWLTASRRDAYDITEWLAKQPWSNGNIGMWGCSATGGSQLQAATTAPPHLKAIFPMSCEFDAYSFRVPGGMAPAKNAGAGVPSKVQAGQKSRDAAAEPVDGDTDRSLLNQAIADHAGTVENEGYAPYRDSFADALTDQGAQPWWIKSSPHHYLDKINVSRTALYLAANWDEGATKHGAFFTFNNVTNPAKLIVGPGGHCGWSAVQGQTKFDITVEERRFFDYWLKGIDNGIMKEDRVYYYTYNAPAGSEWRSAKQWPLPNEKATRFYLGKGSLSTTAPTGVDQQDETTVAYDVTPANTTAKGLIYATAPLGTDVQVTGHPTITLWVTSTATDGDFIATIQDVAPDGTATSYNVNGRLRASMRKLQKAPYNNLGLPWHGFHEADVTPLTPGKPTELVFEILPISMIFKAGHRIRLVINFADMRSTPRIDPAPTVAIYRDSTHKSYVTLPIIEER